MPENKTPRIERPYLPIVHLANTTNSLALSLPTGFPCLPTGFPPTPANSLANSLTNSLAIQSSRYHQQSPPIVQLMLPIVSTDSLSQLVQLVVVTTRILQLIPSMLLPITSDFLGRLSRQIRSTRLLFYMTTVFFPGIVLWRNQIIKEVVLVEASSILPLPR